MIQQEEEEEDVKKNSLTHLRRCEEEQTHSLTLLA
jgi:hypothetical protein